jgi:hypothetical protein
MRKMKPARATASKLMNAPVEQLYKILADYRNGHPLILPPKYFLLLDVEQGGFGEGTITSEIDVPGVVQAFIARMMLEKVYSEALDSLARLAESQSALVISAPVGAARLVEGCR